MMKKIKLLILVMIAIFTLSSCDDLTSCGSGTVVFYNSYGSSITLILDGNLSGNISNGSKKSISVNEGKHTYSIGGSSESSSFDINDCGTLNIEITKK